ncbi:MAG: hypothetical protein ACJ735_02915 [Actinomycetes bacterium]
MTAFALIAVGGVLLLVGMSLRLFALPRLLGAGVAALGVLTTAVGAFRL